jgi:hypothetical protein
MKTLGTSRVDAKHRSSIPPIVMEKLNLNPATKGEPRDLVLFIDDGKGRIYIQKLD